MAADLAAPACCAFISYSSEDRQDALWLQKHLESYEIPRAFHGRLDPCGGTIGPRLGKVFRDRSDLAAGDLGPAIRQALERAQGLIVLCSPRGAKSQWVEQEVLTFKRAGKGHRIFAVILDGEPYAAGKPQFTAEQECFPRALVNALRPDGELGEEREVNQRLAADFRRHADGRTNGVLKLIAGLLGLDLDDLAQRERRAERLRLRIAQRNEARAVNALGRVMAERAWAAMESGDPPLAIRYALAGLKATLANREEFRAVLGAVLHGADRSRLLHGYSGGALSSDGARAVALREDKPPRLVEAEGGREVAILQGHKGRVYAAAFSPDGARVLTAGADGTMRVWDGATGAPLAVLRYEGGGAGNIEFSADGTRLVTARRRIDAHVWDTGSGRRIAVLASDELVLAGAPVFSPDGARVVAAVDKGEIGTSEPRGKVARVWDAGSGTEIASLRGHRATINTVAFSPDGARIVTGSEDGSARVWNAASGNSKLNLRGHADGLRRVLFSPDGSRILTVGRDDARVWDADGGGQLFALAGHGDAVRDGAFSPDGARIVTASLDRTARLWDATTGREMAVLRGHVGPVSGASFTPDGQHVVAISSDGVARIWDTPGGVDHADPAGAPDIPGRPLARSPDGAWLVTLSRSPARRMVEATGRDVAILSDPSLQWGKISSAVFTPDGSRILTSSLSQLMLWDAADGRMLAELSGSLGDASSVVFSADASVAAATHDGKRVSGRRPAASR